MFRIFILGIHLRAGFFWNVCQYENTFIHIRTQKVVGYDNDKIYSKFILYISDLSVHIFFHCEDISKVYEHKCISQQMINYYLCLFLENIVKKSFWQTCFFKEKQPNF